MSKSLMSYSSFWLDRILKFHIAATLILHVNEIIKSFDQNHLNYFASDSILLPCSK